MLTDSRASDPAASCLPCGLHTPHRNAYFDGKLLLARDFVDEQDYGRGHRHLHNSLLHGTGTVCGLKLVQHPTPDCRRDFLVLEAGMALDCCGQEIVVPERALVRVREMLEDDPDLAQALDGQRHLFVSLRRCDTGAEPVPAILPGCEGSAGPTEFGRVAEGFELVLSARVPADVTPVEVPIRPELRWVHTITLGGQVPRAVHLNDAEDLVQIAADADAGGAHVHVHDDRTHDLVSLLEGPTRLSDTASSREARLVLAAGSTEAEEEGPAGGVAFWRAAALTVDARPAGVLPLQGPAARLAVSPRSGALVVLDLVTADSATLSSYSPESIETWLADGAPVDTPPAPVAVLEIGHGFGDQSAPALRGAAMMRFSHDGRFLAVAAPGPAGPGHLYLLDMSAFHAGGMTTDTALAGGVEVGTDVVALAWSLDDAFLFLLAQEAGDSPRAVLTRHALTGEGNALERQGRGVALAGSARDLAVAPTETRAYVLLEDAGGISRLTTVDMERVKAVTGAEPEALELSADTVRVDGDGRSVALAANGGRLYVAAADAEPEGLPDRGLVAVVDVVEDDCSVHVDRLVNGCAGCAQDSDHAVVLGHLASYDAAAEPRMVDPDQAGEDDVAIDNLTYRPIVPSAATLHDVVSCILARGVAEGPPGPRGDPGLDGADGLSVNAVEVELGAPGSDPTGTVVQNDAGLTLQLDLPAAEPGLPGAGIDDARLEYVDGLAVPAVAIVVEGGRRILDIDLPAPRPEGALPPVNPIVGMSWRHAQPFPEFRNEIFDRQRGLAVAFEKPVPWAPFTGSERSGPTMLVELQRRIALENQTTVWAAMDSLEVWPLTDPVVDDEGLLREWQTVDGADESPGFVVRPGRGFDTGFEEGETLRLVVYTDFLVDGGGRPVSGAHVEGLLPTGRGGPAGTFRTWFTVAER